MKREDLITYKLMQRIHQSPNGLTRLGKWPAGVPIPEEA